MIVFELSKMFKVMNLHFKLRLLTAKISITPYHKISRHVLGSVVQNFGAPVAAISNSLEMHLQTLASRGR